MKREKNMEMSLLTQTEINKYINVGYGFLSLNFIEGIVIEYEILSHYKSGRFYLLIYLGDVLVNSEHFFKFGIIDGLAGNTNYSIVFG